MTEPETKLGLIIAGNGRVPFLLFMPHPHGIAAGVPTTKKERINRADSLEPNSFILKSLQKTFTVAGPRTYQ